MKITYIKKETDGVVSEEIHLVLPDVRYPLSGGLDIQMSLADANLFASKLNERLAAIPF